MKFRFSSSAQRRLRPAWWGLALLLVGSTGGSAAFDWTDRPAPKSTLTLRPCRVAGVDVELRCGVHEVFENRQARRGRKLPLKIVLVPARRPYPQRAPVFYLAGGPGETNTEFARHVLSSGYHEDHDIVLVDSRGTGDGHRLACLASRSEERLEDYLRTPFAPEIARACRRELEGRFDLSQYSTAAMVDDLDEVRRALGYERIHLSGGSFGTYAALMYLRVHGRHVRSAYLLSLVPLENRVPLYHAQSAQWALDQLFEQCEADAACVRAYPSFRAHFAAVLARLGRGPVRVRARHPVTGVSTEIELTERAFVDAVRVLTYSGEGGRELPFLIDRAEAGDFASFADTAVRSSHGFYVNAPMGLYYAVTCSEFVGRIRPEDVEPATRGSYAGAWRVQDQMASCREWPKTRLPRDYFAPFRSDVPTLLVSGDTDPASPPRWGETVRAYLGNSVHLIVPGGHVPASACTDSIAAAMFRAGSVRGLETGCVATLRPAPFKRLPTEPPGKASTEGGAQERMD